MSLWCGQPQVVIGSAHYCSGWAITWSSIARGSIDHVCRGRSVRRMGRVARNNGELGNPFAARPRWGANFHARGQEKILNGVAIEAVCVCKSRCRRVTNTACPELFHTTVQSAAPCDTSASVWEWLDGVNTHDKRVRVMQGCPTM